MGETPEIDSQEWNNLPSIGHYRPRIIAFSTATPTEDRDKGSDWARGRG